MKIKLSPDQYSFLQSRLKADDTYLFGKLEASRMDEITFDVDVNLMDEVRDWAGVNLQQNGFNPHHDLTENGRYPEYLIDIFYYH